MPKHRTNIILEEWHYQYLLEKAKSLHSSISELIRKLIENEVDKGIKNIENDSIFSIVGMGSSKNSDIAEEHDKYIYDNDGDDK